MENGAQKSFKCLVSQKLLIRLWLSYQTERRVYLLPNPVIRKEADRSNYSSKKSHPFLKFDLTKAHKRSFPLITRKFYPALTKQRHEEDSQSIRTTVSSLIVTSSRQGQKKRQTGIFALESGSGD